MKKYLFFAMSAAFALAFTSCGSDDPEPVNSGVVTPIKLKKPMFTEVAASYQINDAKCPIKFVELTEGGVTEKEGYGRAVLQIEKTNEVKTRGGDAWIEYFIGSFKWDGKKYTIYDMSWNVYCYLTTSKLSNGKYSVKVEYPDPDQDPIVVEGTAAPKVTETDLTNDLCRSWNVDLTRIRHEGSVKASKDFKGCDLNEILAYAKTKATINEDFPANKVVTDVIFTRSGSFYIFYKNGENDYGTWKWKDQTKGQLNYAWRDAEMGNKFESGEATFDVKAGQYALTLDAKIDDDSSKGEYEISLTFFLSQK